MVAISYDAIILGLGGMGSAAAYHLAVRGAWVLGLEQFGPAHDRGSSHGGSRIIREAYYEDPAYVPLVQRAAVLWRELEHQTNTALFVTTGGLMIGHPDSKLITGSLASARLHGLPHEILSANDLHHRYPTFRLDPDEVAIYEPRVGLLHPEACVRAHLHAAGQHGADLHFEEPVIRWAAQPSGVEVVTRRGRYSGRNLLITAGPWAGKMVTELTDHLHVERIPVFWFKPKANSAAFDPQRCPIYMWQHKDAGIFYGFPRLEGTVKVARHYKGQTTTPDTIDRTVHPDEIAQMRTILQRHIPNLDGELVATATCMYTNSPDGHFIIDRHPAHPQVVVATGFSGHGFKFCSLVGEMLANLTLNLQSQPLDLFRWSRLAGA